MNENWDDRDKKGPTLGEWLFLCAMAFTVAAIVLVAVVKAVVNLSVG